MVKRFINLFLFSVSFPCTFLWIFLIFSLWIFFLFFELFFNLSLFLLCTFFSHHLLHLPPCQILCHYVPYSYSKTLAHGKNPAFSQDVFNMHGFDCTRTYIMIFFLKIMITLLGHQFGRHQRLIMTYNFAKKQKRSWLLIYG